MRKITTVACLAAIIVLSLMAQTKQQIQKALSPEEEKKFQEERARLYQWDAFKFLIGNWKTQGASGNAGFEVTQSLDGKVLIISNNDPAVLPVATNRKAANYKSLTYVYLEGLTPRATLYDNQGRTLTYDVQTAPQKIALISTAAGGRLSFEETKDGVVSIGVQSGAGTTVKAASQANIQAVRVSK